MGTRADFYVGRGPAAEWIGSVAFDGDPGSFKESGITKATTEESYRSIVAAELKQRDDATLPEQGWPWPWENSLTSDYAFAFDGGQVWAHGCCWFPADGHEPDEVHACPQDGGFPDMTALQKVTMGKRSGLIVIGPGGIVDEP